MGARSRFETWRCCWCSRLCARCFPRKWQLRILQTLSPYTLALAVSLVYSMGLANVLFPDSEQLTAGFYAGAAMLVLLVLVNSQVKRAPPPPET